MFLIDIASSGKGGHLDRVVIDNDSVRLTDARGASLIFDGFLHADSDVTMADVFTDLRSGGNARLWARISGSLAGAFIEPNREKMVIFADNTGANEIFYWNSRARHVVSSSLPALLKSIPSSARRLDEDAAAEFQALGTTLLGRTFASGVRQVTPGRYVRLDANGASVQQAWQYRLDHRAYANAELDDVVDAGWRAVRQAAARLLATLGPNAVVSLGLSGGLDSRLTLCAATAAGLDIRPYFFGEPGSSEADSAAMVARQRGAILRRPGACSTFPQYFRQSLLFQPMADLEWCKYWSGRDQLTQSCVAVMSGHLGDHLFGEWSVRARWGPEDDPGLAADLMSSCALEKADDATSDRIASEIAVQTAEIGGSVLQRKQGFWYLAINPSIRRCGLFSTCGAVPHFTLFEDRDVLKHGLAIPLAYRRRNRYYLRLFERYLPDVSPAALPLADGSNGYKPIEKWLYRNEVFRAEVRKLVDLREIYLPNSRHRRIRDVVESIIRGEESRNEIHQFFRCLTIRAYQTTFE